MSTERIIRFVLVIWGVCFVASFLVAWLTPASDFGFTAGLNRITTFLGWQFVASILALGVWIAGRGLPPNSGLKRMSRMPVLALTLLVLIIVAMISYALITKPASDLSPFPGTPTTLPSQ